MDELEKNRFADAPEEPAPSAVQEFHTGLSDDDEASDMSDRYEQARQELLSFTAQCAGSELRPHKTENHQAAPVVNTSVPEATVAPSFRADLNDKQVSQELSELLLKGWLMLDDGCPLTGR